MPGVNVTASGPVLGRRFVDALEFARAAHGDQVRKGTRIPYLSHLLGVASLVLDAGGVEDLAIAGLLHDTVEDTNITVEDVAEAFGERVAAIVAACSDTQERPKPPWRERKERYLAHLDSPETSTDVLLVSVADKLHNARAILADYRAVGNDLWNRFNVGRDGQLWYYRSLVEVFRLRRPGAMADELERVVDELEAETAANC